MDRQAHILVVEDDDIVRTLLASSLQAAGHSVRTARSGAEMAEEIHSNSTDLILLDLGLPDEDGIVLLRQLRAKRDVPVVVLTSRDDSSARRTALELGADDYISKEIHPEEILLRVRNVLRRHLGNGSRAVERRDDEVIVFSGWRLDLAGRTLRTPSGDDVALTAAEFDLLLVLARAPNRVLSRNQLLDALMRFDDAPMDRMVDSYVSRIRRKMGDARFITTVTGVGYRFVPEPA